MKLLDRVLSADESDRSDSAYGIKASPLTQFAIAFASMIHDVAHPGVPNAQLVKEQTDLAITYKNKSVAEQNSVTIAWDLLLQNKFADLRASIFAGDDELQRFRELVVNSVMATDLFDQDLKTLRQERWDKAFAGKKPRAGMSTAEDSDLRATIVIEHIIQASDVSHCMQHWHVYQAWNRRLLEEMYLAYATGRGTKDPTEGWWVFSLLQRD